MHEATAPTLVLVAHGTASARGLGTTAALFDAVRRVRPGTPAVLTYLDVAHPRLPQTLRELDAGPAVVVPLLLSTGYHVQSDIPAACAPYENVRVARHLGPDPLLADVLVDRLAAARGNSGTGATTVLVASGSSRPEAAAELRGAADLLARRLDRDVPVLTVGEGLTDALAGLPRPLEIATYLLAEGRFADTVRTAAPDAVVADPLGVHPALVRLVWQRYDDATIADGGGG